MRIQTEFLGGDFHLAADYPFHDDRLKWESKGVLGYLFSKPETWTPRIYDIVNHGPCEKHKIKSVFKDLEQHGYMHREKFRTEDGTFDWDVTISDYPIFDEEWVSDHPRLDPGWTESTPDAVHPGLSRGSSNKDKKKDLISNKEGSESAGTGTGSDTRARITGDEPWVDESNALYVDEANRLIEKYRPEDCHQLIKNQWGGSRTWAWSAITSMWEDHDWERFVLAAVITANQANRPSPSYMNSVLDGMASRSRADDTDDADDRDDDSDLFMSADDVE